MKNWFLLPLLFLLFACQNKDKPIDIEQLKESYLTAAAAQIPDIKKYDYKVLIGHLNDDNRMDGVIQYGFGEGMRAIGKKLVIVLKDIENKVAFYPIETDYCPIIDTIINKKIVIDAERYCINPPSDPIATYHLFLRGSEIVDTLVYSVIDNWELGGKTLIKDLENNTNLALHSLEFADKELQEIHLKSIKAAFSKYDIYQIIYKEDPVQLSLSDEDDITFGYAKDQLTLNYLSTFKIEDSDLTTESSTKYTFELKDGVIVLIDHQMAG